MDRQTIGPDGVPFFDREFFRSALTFTRIGEGGLLKRLAVADIHLVELEAGEARAGNAFRRR